MTLIRRDLTDPWYSEGPSRLEGSPLDKMNMMTLLKIQMANLLRRLYPCLTMGRISVKTYHIMVQSFRSNLLSLKLWTRG
jgi:hypothetical protein